MPPGRLAFITLIAAKQAEAYAKAEQASWDEECREWRRREAEYERRNEAVSVLASQFPTRNPESFLASQRCSRSPQNGQRLSETQEPEGTVIGN